MVYNEVSDTIIPDTKLRQTFNSPSLHTILSNRTIPRSHSSGVVMVLTLDTRRGITEVNTELIRGVLYGYHLQQDR